MKGSEIEIAHHPYYPEAFISILILIPDRQLGSNWIFTILIQSELPDCRLVNNNGSFIMLMNFQEVSSGYELNTHCAQKSFIDHQPICRMSIAAPHVPVRKCKPKVPPSFLKWRITGDRYIFNAVQGHQFIPKSRYFRRTSQHVRVSKHNSILLIKTKGL